MRRCGTGRGSTPVRTLATASPGMPVERSDGSSEITSLGSRDGMRRTAHPWPWFAPRPHRHRRPWRRRRAWSRPPPGALRFSRIRRGRTISLAAPWCRPCRCRPGTRPGLSPPSGRWPWRALPGFYVALGGDNRTDKAERSGLKGHADLTDGDRIQALGARRPDRGEPDRRQCDHGAGCKFLSHSIKPSHSFCWFTIP